MTVKVMYTIIKLQTKILLILFKRINYDDLKIIIAIVVCSVSEIHKILVAIFEKKFHNFESKANVYYSWCTQVNKQKKINILSRVYHK